MFKLLFSLLKLTLFAALVLVAAHFARWEGRSLSERVSESLNHAERLYAKRARSWTQGVMEDAREGARKLRSSPRRQATAPNREVPAVDQMTASAAAPLERDKADSAPRAIAQEAESTTEEIAPSERAKLKALIRDLNRTRHGR